MSDYKTRSEIASEYGISYSTFKRKLESYNLSVPARELLDRSWQKTIYECVGWPSCVDKSAYDDVFCKEFDEYS